MTVTLPSIMSSIPPVPVEPSTAEHLYLPPRGQSINIDGNTPFLADASGIGEEELQQNQAAGARPRASTGKDWVGGFVVGLKKVANNLGGQQPPPAGPPQYPPESTPAHIPMPDPHPASPVPSGSPTVHGYSDEAYAASETLVHHQNPVSPEAILVEPRPAPDYIKQSPPPRALDRIHKFLRDLNNLPWVARDRVTTDYVPKRRSTRPLSSASYPYTSGVSVDVTTGETLPTFVGGHLNTNNLLGSPSSDSSNKHFQRFETPQLQAPSLPPPQLPRSITLTHSQGGGPRYPNGYTPSQPIGGEQYVPPSSTGHGYVPH